MRIYPLAILLLAAPAFAQLDYTASGYWLCQHVDGTVTQHVVEREAWQECGNEAMANPGTEIIVTPPPFFRVRYAGPPAIEAPTPALQFDADCVPTLEGLAPGAMIDIATCLSGDHVRTITVDSPVWTVGGETLIAPPSGSGRLVVTISIESATVVMAALPWSVTP